jgi:DNA invertase Pin-like site-specific DNA recombinase
LNRPAAITDRHLQRWAIPYVRQSSEQQVRENVGSTALQRDLVQQFLDLGWLGKRIEDPVEDDLGVSGATPGLRRGHRYVIERMKTGEVGAVAVTANDRLGRNLPDFAEFADVARRFDVLLIVGNQVIDFRDPNAEFIATIFGSLAARENRVRTDLSRRARLKKAEAGIAPSGPPVGYIRVPGGEWGKDTDPQVQETIQLLFDKFFEIGTARGLVRYFRRQKVLLPRKPRRGGKRWVEATYSNVLRFLKNPAYSGAYVYGRTVVDERAAPYASGKHRFRASSLGDWFRTPAHHAPYVSPERWTEIQRLLTANRITLVTPAGRGPALVQGLLYCAVHGMMFVTIYPTRQTTDDGRIIRRAQYACRHLRHACLSDQHASIMAHLVDGVIEAELLTTLAASSIDLIAPAERFAISTHAELQRVQQAELRRLETAAAEAERRLEDMDPSYVHVRRKFVERLDSALRDLNDHKVRLELHPLPRPQTLTDAEKSELREFLDDLPKVWHHPRLTAEQRKTIVRTVVKAVWATPGTEAWTLEIEWTGGARTSHTLLTDAGVRSQVRSQMHEAFAFIGSRFAEGGSVRQITEEMNDAKLGQQRGPWTFRRVDHVIWLLQRGKLPGFAPLPRRQSATPRILELHRAGLTPPAIVAGLREEGTRTLRNGPVTATTVVSALRRHGLTPHSAEEESTQDRRRV